MRDEVLRAGERGGEPVGRDARGRPLDQAGDGDTGACRQRQPGGIDQGEYALAREHVTGMPETDEVGDPGNHKRQPECSATMPPVMRWNEAR